MWQAMPRDSHGSLALLVEGIPQAPFERRISFCGCAFCERFLAAPLVSSAVFRNSNIKCHRKSAFVRMRACLCVSFASIKAPLCMESVIRQKLTKHRENRSSYIQCYYSITFLLPYCYFNYVGNLRFMGQTIKFILFDLKFPKFESHHRKNPPKDQCLPEVSYLFIHIFILSI